MASHMRKRFSSKRSAKRPTQWITNVWGGNGTAAIVAATPTPITLLQTGTTQATIAGDTYIMNQRVTVQRVVGDLTVVNTTAAAAYYTIGLMVVDEVAGTPDTFDPTLLTNADKSWLSLRHGWLPATAWGAASNTTEVPFGNHWDVRVKRVMKADQRLQLIITASAAVTITSNFRVLISRVA